MQLVQSNDRANRLSFKGALAHKVEAALSAPAPTETKEQVQVLLVPHNYETMTETDLHFSLMHNKELKHSRQSANLAVEIMFAKTPHPSNVTFQAVRLENPVAIPQFAKKTVKRSPARQLTAPDSTAVRMQTEKDKETAFKAYIDTLPTRVETQGKNGDLILRVPKNYNDFSEAELFHVLMNTTELEHSRTSAYMAMDILSGKVAKPQNVTLQSVVLPQVVPTTPAPIKVKEVVPSHVVEAERGKREQFKANLADKASVISKIEPNQYRPVTIFRLPAHYEELSQAGLFYTLTHNPELQHTTETANLAIAFLSGVSTKPEWVEFQTIEITAPVEAQVQTLTKVDPLKDFIPERELEKRAQIKDQLSVKAETAFQAKPEAEKAPKDNTIHRAGDLPAPRLNPIMLTEPKKIELAIHPEIKASDIPKRQLFKEELADRARAAFNAKPVLEEKKELKTVLLPEGYETMSPGELHFALVRNPELHHSQESARYALDVLAGKIKNASVQFSVVILENPQLAPATLPRIPKVQAANMEKKSAIIINRPSLLTRAQIPIADSGERVLKIPHNYEEMNETQLHFALSHNREYGHSYESTYEALDILYGRNPCPEGTVFSVVEVEKPIERAN